MEKVFRNITLFLIICFAEVSFAQKLKKPQNLPRYDLQKLHFGFTIGINSLDFIMNKNLNYVGFDSLVNAYSNNQYGFNLGIVSNLRLGKFTDLRFIPTLVFGERILDYNFKLNNNNENVITESKRIESTLLDFPFHLKYKSERYNNIRTFIITGIKYSLDIASQDKIDDEGEELVKLKKHDIMVEIGFGIDFYLEYFKFSPQIKLSHGIFNVLNKENTIYTKSFNQLRTNGWMLSFTFE